MKNKKLLFAILTVVVISIVILGITLIFSKEKFEQGSEGLILKTEYEEKYNVITNVLTVNRDKYNMLVAQNNISLNEGTLKFEIINPQNVTVKSGEVSSTDSLDKQYEFKPIKGNWIIKYYINENTDGTYKLNFKSK